MTHVPILRSVQLSTARFWRRQAAFDFHRAALFVCERGDWVLIQVTAWVRELGREGGKCGLDVSPGSSQL